MRDLRFDRQIDEPRGDWLWSLLEASGTTAAFRDPILAAWCEPIQDDNAVQLCELARRYAKAGDEPFVVRLREVVAQNIGCHLGTFGEPELLELDGESGLLFIAEKRGSRLAERPWDIDDLLSVDEAIKRLGEDRVVAVLQQSIDPGVARFRLAWEEARSAPRHGNDDGGSGGEEHRGLDANDIFKEAHRAPSRNWLFRRWGMHADERHLTALAGRLCEVSQPEALGLLLQAFANQPCSQVIAPALTLCRHGDERVRARAYAALERNAHPAIREFAIQKLRPEGEWIRAVGLLRRNFESGDEERIAEVLATPDVPDDCHWLFTDVLRVLQDNVEARVQPLALAAWFHTPCTFCRGDAMELLHTRGRVPDWMAEESQYDCATECRALLSPGESE